jgi:uncharacterized protein (TIGR02679 family)
MHPDLQRDLLELLREPALERLLEALHASLVKHGEPRGRVEICDDDEAHALQGIIGKRFTPGKKASVATIDKMLRENTRFRCSLANAVKMYRGGGPIVRPKVVKAQAAAAREQAVRRCFEQVAGLGLSAQAYSRVIGWMHASEMNLRNKAGSWGEQPLLIAVRAVALAFGRMPERNGPTVYLAELAAEITGDAKAFDATRPAGRLLLRALAFYHRDVAAREKPGSAAWKTALLTEAGIARDPISVHVDTFGLTGDTPYLRELRRAALTRSMNLDNLIDIADDVRAWRGVAFVVENPTVFAALTNTVRKLYRAENHPTLVCTNGNLNPADWKLLEALCATGAHLFYSGDFDGRGLGIVTHLLNRYPEAASPWRMTPDDYLAALRDGSTALDTAGLERVKAVFPELVAEMTARGQAAHHEALIGRFEDDLDRWVRRGITPPRRGEGPRFSTAAGTRP